MITSQRCGLARFVRKCTDQRSPAGPFSARSSLWDRHLESRNRWSGDHLPGLRGRRFSVGSSARAGSPKPSSARKCIWRRCAAVFQAAMPLEATAFPTLKRWQIARGGWPPRWRCFSHNSSSQSANSRSSSSSRWTNSPTSSASNSAFATLATNSTSFLCPIHPAHPRGTGWSQERRSSIRRFNSLSSTLPGQREHSAHRDAAELWKRINCGCRG